MSMRLVAQLHGGWGEVSRLEKTIWKNLMAWRANNCVRAIRNYTKAIIGSHRGYLHRATRVLGDEWQT
jgi:hypothetical protein